MKKLRLAALLLLAALFPGLLTGCHGSRGLPAFRVPESFDASRSYELTFWAKNDTNKNQTMIYEKAIRDFEALYPNIRVSLRLYTDYGRIYNDVITNIATGTTPNVCITYPDHIATYLTGVNVMAPLDDLAADSRYGLGGSEVRFDGPGGEEIVSGYLEECRFSGHLYALPFMRSTEALYVNRTFVEKLGYTLPETVTWDFIWEVSDAAARQDGDGTYLLNGQKVMIPFIYKSTDNMMIQMLRQKGAGFTTEAGEVLLFNQDTREILLEIAVHARSRAFSTFSISSYPGNWLNAGQCIFAVDSTAGATWMGTDAPLLDIPEEQLVDFEMVVLPVPQFDPEHPQMISQGPSVCVFYKDDPQEVLASWLFAQFLLTNSVQIAYSETEGYVPVTLKAQQDPAYQDYLSRAGENNDLYYPVKIQAAQLLMANTENTFTTPVFNGSTAVRNAAGILIENVCKSERRRQPVDDAFLDQLRTEVCSRYELEPAAPGWTAGSGETGGVAGDAQGPLPGTARALLITLAVVWVLIGLASGYSALKRKREKKKS